MMKNFTLALAALISTPAFGQAYDHPDWLDGSVPVMDWTIFTAPEDAPTGVAPADSYEPAEADESAINEGDWITAADQTGYVENPLNDRKFRITCEPGTAKVLDPILFPGVAPPVGHAHEGIGNIGWNENSTYTSLRASPSATCTGGPLNGTIYWEPGMMKQLPSGVTVTIRPQDVSFYYISGKQNEDNYHTWLRRNFRFIGGANPMDYNDQVRRDAYAAGGFEYPGSPNTPAGFIGYQCYAGADLGSAITVTELASRQLSAAGFAQSGMSRHLVNEDGDDPWGGNCTGTVEQPGAIIANLIAPGCWDRHNLGAPDGRGHLAFATRRSNNEDGNSCPTVVVSGVRQDFSIVPALTTKTTFLHTGFADYGTWWLSSDRMNAADTPADTESLDPCRAEGPYFCPGSTLHFDWWNGWNSDIADEWQLECLGIPVRGATPVHGPAECNDSQISFDRKLKYGVSPDSNLSGGCATILSCTDAEPAKPLERYNPVPIGTPVTGILHSHGED